MKLGFILGFLILCLPLNAATDGWTAASRRAADSPSASELGCPSRLERTVDSSTDAG